MKTNCKRYHNTEVLKSVLSDKNQSFPVNFFYIYNPIYLYLCNNKILLIVDVRYPFLLHLQLHRFMTSSPNNKTPSRAAVLKTSLTNYPQKQTAPNNTESFFLLFSFSFSFFLSCCYYYYCFCCCCCCLAVFLTREIERLFGRR